MITLTSDLPAKYTAAAFGLIEMNGGLVPSREGQTMRSQMAEGPPGETWDMMITVVYKADGVEVSLRQMPKMDRFEPEPKLKVVK